MLNVEDHLAELSKQMAPLHHGHDKLILTPLVQRGMLKKCPHLKTVGLLGGIDGCQQFLVIIKHSWHNMFALCTSQPPIEAMWKNDPCDQIAFPGIQNLE